jgi:glucokinase
MILAGDIGGTRARLALYDERDASAKAKPLAHAIFESRAFPSLEAVVQTFLRDAGESGKGGKSGKSGKAARKKAGKLVIKAATFGIAGPVIDQRCAATNFPWVVDARVVARKIGVARVTLLNDLVALAFGALVAPKSRIRVLHGGSAPKKRGGNLAVIAAGTGLGEAGLVWDGDRHVPLATEGGHTDLAARSPIEWELCAWLEKRFGHVSYERVVAGPGFSHLYEFFHEEKRISETRENDERLAEATDRNATIAQLGAEGTSEPATRALDLFARIYGAEAGNLALKTLATAGVFVAGGIAGHMVETLAKGPFVEAFLDKGRFRPLLEKVPLAVVMDADIGLAGSRYHARMMSEG